MGRIKQFQLLSLCVLLSALGKSNPKMRLQETSESNQETASSVPLFLEEEKDQLSSHYCINEEFLSNKQKQNPELIG